MLEIGSLVLGKKNENGVFSLDSNNYSENDCNSTPNTKSHH